VLNWSIKFYWVINRIRSRPIGHSTQSWPAKPLLDPEGSLPSDHSPMSNGCRYFLLDGEKQTSAQGFLNGDGRWCFEWQKASRFKRFSKKIPATPIIIFDEQDTKFNPLDGLYMFLSFDSTFDQYLDMID
jgi:hypothetical protein